jgi:hypothetical protein
MAFIGSAMLFGASGSALAQTPARVGCATGSGVTGSATQKGTDFTKQDDGKTCPNVILIWAQGSGHFAGFYKNQNGVWVEGNLRYLPCSGTCNKALLTNVKPGTEVTINNETAGDGDDPIQVSF